MLTLIGPPKERGRQHGEARRDAIRRRVAEAVIAPARAIDDVDRLALPWERTIRAVAPDVASEIEGIAEGSGSRIAEVVLLNAFEAFEVGEQVVLTGCTAVAVPRPGGALVGQNWDANPGLAASVEVHVHEPDRGPRLALLASPGGLGWIGLNGAGLALVTNDLLTPGRRTGVPSQVARRLMLGETDVPAALAVLRRTAAVGGRAYVLGDAAGRVAVAEVATERDDPWAHDADRPIAHTNHAHDPDLAACESTELLASIYPSTHRRLARATAMLDSTANPTRADLRAILADHDSYPASVCHHASRGEPTVTAASVLFDCARRVAGFAIGNPCTSQYQAVSL